MTKRAARTMRNKHSTDAGLWTKAKQAEQPVRPRHETRPLDCLCLAPCSAEFVRKLPVRQKGRLCKGCAVPKDAKEALHNEKLLILIGRRSRLVTAETVFPAAKTDPGFAKRICGMRITVRSGQRRDGTRGNMWQPYDRSTSVGKSGAKAGQPTAKVSVFEIVSVRGPAGKRVLSLTRAAREALRCRFSNS